MKKSIYIFILALPLLLATTCDDEMDSGFETTFFIENTTEIDLYLLSDNGTVIEINSEDMLLLGSALNQDTRPISPSESLLFNTIKLYKLVGNDFIQVYNQDPIDNALWMFEEPSTNRFEYTFYITDDIID